MVALLRAGLAAAHVGAIEAGESGELFLREATLQANLAQASSEANERILCRAVHGLK